MSPALSILVAACIQVESRGLCNAVGQRGEVGCLQIRPAVIQDVNRILAESGAPFRFDLTDRLSHDRSISIFRIYVNHYATEERIGREPTIQDIARIWNGGPNGYRLASTQTYWRRVLKQIGKAGAK